ncbi:hypothetical protein [Streptomyces kaniharaensis]|uniref:hypothetical protein n=1 Tax=Streptomyces kaniharaensis TaxID=212423 RepID=UPI001E2A7B33|nr:hypothetical protein [Streptomyces kaniharaensis]
MVDDGHHVVALHRPGRADLLLEPAAELLVAGELLADHLDRDRLAAARPGQVDGPHAALADPAQQRVPRDVARVARPQRRHARVVLTGHRCSRSPGIVGSPPMIKDDATDLAALPGPGGELRSARGGAQG